MTSYLAQLGNHPSLSISELATRIPDMQMQGVHHHGLLFQTEQDLDQDFLNTLGGTVLLAREVTQNVVDIQDVPKLLLEELSSSSGKVCFSLRFFGLSGKVTKDLYKQCKNELKKHEVPSRYIGSAASPAQTVQLHDEGLLNPKKGAELVLLQKEDHLTVLKTVAAQDIKSYTRRDMEKPVRDTTVGLLPPKLAQILLNFGLYLVQKNNTAPERMTVFDPFCGTGVIPIEALLRGWDVYASDMMEKAVSGCKKNMQWAQDTLSVPKGVTTTIWKQNATKPFEMETLPTVVITEGTLGPALQSRPLLKNVKEFQKKVDAVMTGFIENAAETLPGVPLVLTLPVWYAQKRLVPLPKVWNTIEEHYIPVLPPLTEPALDGRHSMLYRRKDQYVGREIVLLKPKK